MFSKQKLLQVTTKHGRNHHGGHGHPLLLSKTLFGAGGPLQSCQIVGVLLLQMELWMTGEDDHVL